MIEFSNTVLQDDDERLRQECRDWNPQEVPAADLKQLIREMRRVMHEEGGVGLAAPQVGVGLNLFIMECRGADRYPGMPEIPFQAIINPKVKKVSRRTSRYEEGCLSVPGCRIAMVRPSAITVSYLDEHLRPRTRQFKGLEGRIFQHENDHLNGVLLTDYLPEDFEI